MSLESLAATAAAAERASDWHAAHNLYDHLYADALAQRDLEKVADALRGLSRVSQQRQRFEAAEEFAELSLQIAEGNRHGRAAARALNTLAVIRFLQHDLAGARQLYTRARERATDCGDDALVGWSCQNLGILANLDGDLAEARALYMESVAASVRSSDDTTAVAAFNNLGLICTEMEEWTDAVLYFDRGLEIVEDLGDLVMRATLLCNRARPLIYLGEWERAEAALDEAGTLALRITDRRTQTEVHRYRGLSARLQRRPEQAEAELSRALELAGEAQLPLEHAEALEEVAHLRWQEGREGAARVLAREALLEYGALGVEHHARRIRRLLERWSPQGSEGAGGSKIDDFDRPAPASVDPRSPETT